MLEDYIKELINFKDFNSKLEEIKKNLNIKSFIDYLYDIVDIKRNETKYIDTHKLDYLYLESEQIQNKNDLKIFSVCYFYKDCLKKYEYIDQFLYNLELSDNTEYKLNDYYFYVYIDFTIFLYIDKDEKLKEFIRRLLNNHKILIQFYYGDNNLCINENVINHNNVFGFFTRLIPFIINDNISECHIRDMDMGFINYMTYNVINNIKNSNHLIYLTSGTGYTQGVKQIQEHKQYIINNYGFMGGVLGFHKTNIFNFNSDVITFQSLLIQFIKNDVKDIVNTNYQNYEYGIDEILLLYYYYICSKNIYVIDGNQILKYILLVGNNLNCIFNYVIDNLSLITLRDKLTVIALFIYNYEYISDNNIYNSFKDIFIKVYL